LRGAISRSKHEGVGYVAAEGKFVTSPENPGRSHSLFASTLSPRYNHPYPPRGEKTQMKRPQFRLRTLFVAITLIGVIIGWVVYQLNWIRQRHIFYDRFNAPHFFTGYTIEECPWSLRLFGEKPQFSLWVPQDRIDEAKRLFPEAYVSSAEK
jgi:hypothetical protein